MGQHGIFSDAEPVCGDDERAEHEGKAFDIYSTVWAFLTYCHELGVVARRLQIQEVEISFLWRMSKISGLCLLLLKMSVQACTSLPAF